MTIRDTSPVLTAVGALRAPTALLALVLAAAIAATAGAHGPVRRQPLTTPPDGGAAPPSEPLRPGALGGAAPSLGTPTTGVLPLRTLAAESAAIVVGVVATTDSLDEDKLRVYHVRVDQTVKGTVADGGAAIVEMRGATSRPGLLADGTRALLLLRAAPPLSYLTQHLPVGRTHLALTGGRDGIVPVASDAEARVVEEILAEGMRIQGLEDESAARAARRALAFRELAAGHPRLAADALVELRGLDDLVRPTPEELAVFGGTLQTVAVAAPTRVALVHLAGKRGWKDVVPALRAATIDSPLVLDAVLTVRAQLGAPAGKDELAGYLTSPDPAVRSAAIRALAALDEPAVTELGRFATGDEDVHVRVAAIEALGATGSATVVPTLSQTFGEPSRDIRQASGRALLALGGPAAGNALANLALHGRDADTRAYAAALLLVSTGRESPEVRRVLASDPSPEVREVIEHGFQWKHMHQE